MKREKTVCVMSLHGKDGAKLMQRLMTVKTHLRYTDRAGRKKGSISRYGYYLRPSRISEK